MEHEHNLDEDRVISLVNENGDEELFEILLTFESEEFEKTYILLYPMGAYDDEDDEEGPEILAYSYIPTEDGGYGPLMEIEDEKEWEMVEEVFNTFVDEQEE